MTLIDLKKFVDGILGSTATKTVWSLIQTVVLAIVGMVMLYPQLMYENFSKYQEKKHATAIERRLENDPAIRDILNDISKDIDAERVFICEFHNGTNNFAGLPFLYMDMKYEMTKIGVQHIDDEYINFNLTRYPFVPYAIEKQSWFGTTAAAAEIDDRFANNLKRDDTEYLGVVLINGTDNIIGVLGVTYSNEKRNGVSEIAIRRCLTSNAQKLAILLSE